MLYFGRAADAADDYDRDCILGRNRWLFVFNESHRAESIKTQSFEWLEADVWHQGIG